MRRALVLALLYVDDLHAFGWSEGDEARFDREFNRVVGVTPRQFMHLAGHVSARPEEPTMGGTNPVLCMCVECCKRRWRDHWDQAAIKLFTPSGNIWLGAQAAQMAFGTTRNQLGMNQIARPDPEGLKTHHRSCGLRTGGTTCTC